MKRAFKAVDSRSGKLAGEQIVNRNIKTLDGSPFLL
jgi:hypothetical protein